MNYRSNPPQRQEPKDYSNQLSVDAHRKVEERDYWLKKLSGHTDKCSFPYDRKKSARRPRRMTQFSFTFSDKLTGRILEISNNSELRLYIILVTGLVELLKKYTGKKDIILGAPIYKQEIEADFINTLLLLRIQLDSSMTVKELLIQVSQTISEAVRYANYPFETLLYQLDIAYKREDDFPLFDVVVFLDNIQDKKYIDSIYTNVRFSFAAVDGHIEGCLEYNTAVYDEETAKQWVQHLSQWLERGFFNPSALLSEIDLISSRERRQLLEEFNANSGDYPAEETLCSLITRQKDHAPQQIAVYSEEYGREEQLTYDQLAQKASGLARLLREKGLGKDDVIGLMTDRTTHMIVGIMGILEAGGAYLPINPEYPDKRISFLLEDSQARLLLTQTRYLSAVNHDGETIDLEAGETYGDPVPGTCDGPSPNHLAYIIYTSGSTGMPKGVMIEHRHVINLVYGLKQKIYDLYPPHLHVALVAPFIFDASVQQIFGALLLGHGLYIVPETTRVDGGQLLIFFHHHRIDVSDGTPAHLQLMLDSSPQLLATLQTRHFIIGGEALPQKVAHRFIKSFKEHSPIITNVYGPAECCVDVSAFDVTINSVDIYDDIPIGKPMLNRRLYLLDKNLGLTPIGVPGEIHISGHGICRGYLGQQRLTTERFIPDPFEPGLILYKTGDLARWLKDGNIEFLGRIDSQVKIRGYRIELGEIEQQLLLHPGVKESVVIVNDYDDGGDGNKFLCAYVVTPETIESSELREFLAKILPEYMIPSYFVSLDSFPLTPNGKIDRKALPDPNLFSGAQYVAPRNDVEQKLADIWSDVLNIDKDQLGIDNGFFEVGGHSLKATILIANIHKTFNVKIPVAEIFSVSTIRGLAEYIRNARQDRYSAIQSVESREYYPLSSAQKRLYILDRIAPDEVHYNIPQVIPVNAPDIDAYNDAFRALIARHQSLRTSFLIVGEEPAQKVHDTVPFEVATIDAGNRSTIDILRNFVRPFDLSSAPLMRVALLVTKNKRQLLMVDMHHIISDGVSHQVMSREFMALYEGKTLGPLLIQYKDFAVWQNNAAEKEKIVQQEQFWLDEFKEPAPVLDLPTDYPRPAFQSFEGAGEEFSLSSDQTRALKDLILQSNATLFMLVTAVFNALLARLSNQDDIVIGTPIAGRRHADLEQVIGMFVNTLALRNYPHSNLSFRQFLQSVKERSLVAFENQEYQFEDLVDRLTVHRDDSRNPLFDVMFTMQNTPTADATEHLEISHDDDLEELDRFLDSVAKFDLTLTAVEADNQLHFVLQYCTKLFKTNTIQRMIAYFKRLTASFLSHPDQALHLADIISEEEKCRLLQSLGGKNRDYPMDRPIHAFIEDQTRSHPDRTALVEPKTGDAQGQFLTYAQLNERAHGLGALLHQRGLNPGDIAAMMLSQSPMMVIAILAVLKTGAAYLPVDAQYPAKRICYILDDSRAPLLLTQTPIKDNIPAHTAVVDLSRLDLETEMTVPCEDDSPQGLSGDSVAYVIYTSGTTGRPKGTVVEHRSLQNMCLWQIDYYRLTSSDRPLKYAGIAFDASVLEIFPYLICGAAIYFPGDEVKSDIHRLNQFMETHGITISFLPTQVAEQFMTLQNTSLRILYTGGDKLRGFTPQNYTFVNNYGPTEYTVVSSAFTLDKHTRYDNIPIGKPVFNTRLYILDNHLQLQPVGVVGELFIGGAGMSRGYLNRPELTAHRFIENPYQSGERLYRSGDLARRKADGNIEFHGRVDNQVQLRGFRIEIGEIENVLLSHKDVKEVLVLVKALDDSKNDDLYICAYVVSDKMLAPASLREFMSELLPQYMVPSFFIQLKHFPLTPNGKIDYRALPEPERSGGSRYIAPRDELEQTLANIWTRALAKDQSTATPVGIDDNFFQLGGHSLNAMIAAANIHKVLDINVPLAEFFKTPTIRGLAQYIRSAATEHYSAIQPVESREYYPLSSAQKRLFILNRIAPDEIHYNMPQVMPVNAPDIDVYNDTFRALFARHQSLRTSFLIVGEEPAQKVHDTVPFEVAAINAGNRPTIDILRDFVRPFDLSSAPLMRVALLVTKNKRQLLMVDMHHIISDGVSHQVMSREFLALYEGKTLGPLLIQYKDFAVWQNSAAEKEKIVQQEQFWLDEFKEPVPVLDLPTDYPRPSFQSFEGASEEFSLLSDQTRALKDLGLQSNATLFIVLTAVFNVLLAWLSNQYDIVVGTPIAGRRHADLEHVIGMFVNTLVLRNFPQPELSFHQFLQSVKERSLAAFENQEYQFEDLMEQVTVNRDASRNPLFDVMFNLQTTEPTDAIDTRETTPDNDLDELNQFLERIAKFDLTLAATEADGQLHFSFRYCTALFKAETIQRMTDYFKRLIDSLVSNPHRVLSHLDIISAQEKQKILLDFNRTGAPQYPGTGLTHLFSNGVRKHLGRVSVISEEHYISYGELERRALRLARILCDRGVCNGGIVALLTRRSVEMAIAIMGTLFAGAAYLPLSPENPPQRNLFMLKDSQATILFTTDTGESGWLKEGTNISEVVTPEILSTEQPLSEAPTPGADDLAYVIYTSGSTGQPKAVMMHHYGVINLVHGLNERIYNRYDGLLKVAMVAPYVFDASVKQIFAVLLGGHTLDIIKEENRIDGEALLQHILQHCIDICDGTPSHIRLLLESLKNKGPINIGGELPRFTVRHFIIGGEALPRSLVERFFSTLNLVCGPPVDTEISNVYGPAECCVDSTSYRIIPANVGAYPAIPIGKPMPGEQVYILDRQLGLKPIGAVGELCIGGSGVGRGYLKRPALTAEKFVLNPYFNDVSSELDIPPHMNRIYRTGDLARWLPDGNIQFLGRMDNQVQLRGFRIEIGEIENVLLTHKDVKEALVRLKTLDKSQNDDLYICAYVVSDKMLVSASLREFMVQLLPQYMVPTFFIQLKHFPLTPNGKIDHRALAQVHIPGMKDQSPPANDVERKLAEIWAQLLGLKIEHIGVQQDFFTVGGHSLKATILAVRIREAFTINIPVAELFNRTTIRSQAEYIRQSKDISLTGPQESVLLLKKGNNPHHHFFLIHDGTGGIDGYIDFVNHVDSRFICWGVAADQPTHLAPQNLNIRRAAEAYISRIKKINGKRPFFIAGWSLGGSIAFEMARQLEHAGDTVALTALIDSPTPADSYEDRSEGFSLAAEIPWIKHLLPEGDIAQVIDNQAPVSDIDGLWDRIVVYLENKMADETITNAFLLKFFPSGTQQLIPNYKDLSIKEFISRLNAVRSWGTARAQYFPDGSLQSHLEVVAAQSSDHDVEKWRQFAGGTFNYETIPGSHYSILKQPDIQSLIKIINKRMSEILENM